MKRKERKIHCRYCRKEQPLAVGRCRGCGMTEDEAAVSPHRVNPKRRRQCPACRGIRISPMEEERYWCLSCGMVFEDCEVGFLDDRPVENAVKRERESNGRRRGGPRS